VGTRGYASLDWMPYRGAQRRDDHGHLRHVSRLHRARPRPVCRPSGGATPATYLDYHDLLADKSVDAVFIMTPEHLHHDMTIAALQAGKHVYIEKPLAHTIEEGSIWCARGRSPARSCKWGTQNRSSSLYKRAKENSSRKGYIGDVHYARAFWYRNSLPGRSGVALRDSARYHPQKHRLEPLSGHGYQAAVGFASLLPVAPLLGLFGRISTDLLVHQTDIVNFMLDKTVPRSCMASGGIYRWTDKTDDREVPDTLSAIYEYDGGFHINYSCYFGNERYGYGEQICGNEGTSR